MATKKEIIELLTSKGIAFDPKQTKDQLAALLPADGGEGTFYTFRLLNGDCVVSPTNETPEGAQLICTGSQRECSIAAGADPVTAKGDFAVEG